MCKCIIKLQIEKFNNVIRYGVAVTFSPFTAEPRVRLPVSEPLFFFPISQPTFFTFQFFLTVLSFLHVKKSFFFYKTQNSLLLNIFGCTVVNAYFVPIVKKNHVNCHRIHYVALQMVTKQAFSEIICYKVKK